jgi:hypothetical protein
VNVSQSPISTRKTSPGSFDGPNNLPHEVLCRKYVLYGKPHGSVAFLREKERETEFYLETLPVSNTIYLL